MRRVTKVFVLASAVLVLAGGMIHLREWLDTYRFVPDAAPGAFVVKLGFPLNTATALVFTAALVLTISSSKFSRFLPLTLIGAIGFQVTSLAILILTRTGTVFGWTEPVWNNGANQVRAVEIAAIVTLAIAGKLRADDSDPIRRVPTTKPVRMSAG